MLKSHEKNAVISKLATEILKKHRKYVNNAKVAKEFFIDPKLRKFILRIYGLEILFLALALVLTVFAVSKFFSKRIE